MIVLLLLFAFMEHGISSLRELEKLCRNDIRFLYLLRLKTYAKHIEICGVYARMERTLSERKRKRNFRVNLDFLWLVVNRYPFGGLF